MSFCHTEDQYSKSWGCWYLPSMWRRLWQRSLSPITTPFPPSTRHLPTPISVVDTFPLWIPKPRIKPYTCVVPSAPVFKGFAGAVINFVSFPLVHGHYFHCDLLQSLREISHDLKGEWSVHVSTSVGSGSHPTGNSCTVIVILIISNLSGMVGILSRVLTVLPIRIYKTASIQSPGLLLSDIQRVKHTTICLYEVFSNTKFSLLSSA